MTTPINVTYHRRGKSKVAGRYVSRRASLSTLYAKPRLVKVTDDRNLVTVIDNLTIVEVRK